MITSVNAATFAQYLPEAARFAVMHGFKIVVAPSRRLEWSAGYKRATEKYSPQVRLDTQDHLTNYVAGMPFPLVEITDPKAAIKIAYNWHMGPFMPDDFVLSPWSSNAYARDPSNPSQFVSKGDADFACANFTFLRFAHRTEVAPRPTIGANALGFEWKARCDDWTTMPEEPGSEGAGIWVRYLDPKSPDEFYGFNEMSRRVRRIDVSGQYPGSACRRCHQPYWAYALPKTEVYSYRFLGTATLLACLSAADEPAGVAPAQGGFRLTQEPFELRHAYIIEMRPQGGNPDQRTVIYIDSEVYVWLAAEFYSGGVESASAIPMWRMRPAPEGGNLFDLAGSIYVPAGKQNFRTLVPPSPGWKQEINTGQISESSFNPSLLQR